MLTKIVYDEEARLAIKNGFEKVAKAVTVTLGPKGQNVALSRPYGAPIITHDGVTVAEGLSLNDPLENEAAKLIKDTAEKTNNATGDGTTTVTLLTSEMAKQGIKLVTVGANGMSIRRGMEKALPEIIEKLKEAAVPVGDSDVFKVASVSAQNQEIGKKIDEAFKLVGSDGKIQAEEGYTPGIEVTHKKGMSFEKGMVTQHFVTNDRDQAVYEDVYVLITDKSINTLDQLKGTIEMLEKKKPVLLIAENYSPLVITTLAINHIRQSTPVVAVTAPEFGPRKQALLQDIAILTGGKFFSSELNEKVETASGSDFGIVERVVVDKNSTLLIPSQEENPEVKLRIESLRAQLEKEENDFEKDFIKKRIAKLSGGVAMISAGGASEAEISELVARIDDAIGATHAAIEEGVVVGGGTILKTISDSMKYDGDDEDEKAGYNLVKYAIQQPMRLLISNSGDDAGRMIERIDVAQSRGEKNFGYNAYTGKVEDLLKAGIIDPVKVLRVALENSVSTAKTAITVKCLVAQVPDEKKE